MNFVYTLTWHNYEFLCIFLLLIFVNTFIYIYVLFLIVLVIQKAFILFYHEYHVYNKAF